LMPSSLWGYHSQGQQMETRALGNSNRHIQPLRTVPLSTTSGCPESMTIVNVCRSCLRALKLRDICTVSHNLGLVIADVHRPTCPLPPRSRLSPSLGPTLLSSNTYGQAPTIDRAVQFTYDRRPSVMISPQRRASAASV